MLFNNLTVAFRNLSRNRLHTAINVSGLGISMAASMLMLLWVANELSFDRFHLKSERIYRINAAVPMGGQANSVWVNTPAPLATLCQEAVPEIEAVVRVKMSGYQFRDVRFGDKVVLEKKFAYIDPGFFSMFDFPLLQGNPQAPFPDNQSVIISKSLAEKLFARENPMGQSILIGKDKLTVCGVADDLPDNSSIKAQVLLPLGFLADRFQPNATWKTFDTDWGNYNYQTFVVPTPTFSNAALEEKLTNLLHEHKANSSGQSLRLQSLASIHLTQANGEDAGMKIVQIFLALAFIILGIACINYINLSTAQAVNRTREVGMRKLIGANRSQLFGQFMTESAIILMVSVVFSATFITALLPVYKTITDTTLDFSSLNGYQMAYGGAMVLGAWAATGIYPALLLSGFHPLKAIKGEWVLGKSAIFQKSLVVTQFAFSIAITMAAFIINRQLQFTMNKDLGFNRENMLVFPLNNMDGKVETLKTEMAQLSGVNSLTTLGGVLLEGSNSTTDTDWDGCPEKDKFMIHQFSVDKNFFKTMGVKFVEGDDFNDKSLGAQGGYILNEAAIRGMGLQNPIGKRFSLHSQPGLVLGVVRDFNFVSLHKEIEPVVFYCAPEEAYRLYVKATPAAFDKAIALAGQYWKASNPVMPFEYQFLDETYDNLYKKEKRSAALFYFFALVTIFISCLGLFGLAVHSTQLRMKEIGIRKVLGASVAGITGLLTKDFLTLVVAAIVLASPAAYYIMQKWLSDFAYRIDIQWWMFAVAGLAAVVIAFLTVGFQSVKAALANPVNSLRNE